MGKGTVLVIGNSGVGKSTLINAVLGEERAETGWGIKGTTGELKIYENETAPFRVVDTIGFEPSLLKSHQAINSVKKWSVSSTKENNEDRQINIIWMCIDGTAAKLFPKTISDLMKATSIWKTVPIIAVITKSYAVPDRERNIEMVKAAFANKKVPSQRLKRIIPVVASTFVLNESAYAAPDGIAELIDATNELMPEGERSAVKDIAEYKLLRRRILAHGTVVSATALGAAVGIVNFIPFADAAVLAPIEAGVVNSLARIYGLSGSEKSKMLINSIIEAGTVGTAAKLSLSALKSIPGINLAAGVLNGVVAGVFVALLGEGSIYAFEQVSLGNKSMDDIDWVQKIIEAELTSRFIDAVNSISQRITDKADAKTIAAAIIDVIFNSKKAAAQKDKIAGDGGM